MLYRFETIRHNRHYAIKYRARKMFFINHELASKQYAFGVAVAAAIVRFRMFSVFDSSETPTTTLLATGPRSQPFRMYALLCYYCV